MAKTKAIVKRRKAVRNVRKITRTMELISTARYKKAMDRAVQSAAYTKKIAELVADLSQTGASVEHPLLRDRPETKKSILLVLTSNRGLCGGYNANITRVAVRHLESVAGQFPISLEVSGKRGIAFFKYRGVPADRTYMHFEDKPSYAEVEELADRYLGLFLKGQIDRLDVAYTKFVSIGKQEAQVATLLPMSSIAESKSAGPEKRGPAVQYEFMPSAGDILAEIVPVSFKVRLFKCFLDAAVSEQIARMVAMKGATENAGKLIKLLTRKYNRARQAQITSEIAEIIGAVEALK